MNKRIAISMTLLCVSLLACTLFGCTPQMSDVTFPPDNSVTLPIESLALPETAEPSVPPVTPEPTAEPTPEPVLDLPLKETVNCEETPLLYDFLYSCLDWHVPVLVEKTDPCMYLLRHDSTPNILYVSWYVVQNGYSLPPAPCAYERRELTVEELDTLNKVWFSLPSEYLVREGEWELCIYGGEAVEPLESTGIRFWTMQGYPEGTTRPFLEDGTGWPTEWLRREPYVTNIKERLGIDMNDPFWDLFRLQGTYEMVPGEHATPVGTPKITCTGFKTFRFEHNGQVLEDVSWDEIRDDCNHIGYNIPGIYNAWDWEPAF